MGLNGDFSDFAARNVAFREAPRCDYREQVLILTDGVQPQRNGWNHGVSFC